MHDIYLRPLRTSYIEELNTYRRGWQQQGECRDSLVVHCGLAVTTCSQCVARQRVFYPLNNAGDDVVRAPLRDISFVPLLRESITRDVGNL